MSNFNNEEEVGSTVYANWFLNTEHKNKLRFNLVLLVVFYGCFVAVFAMQSYWLIGIKWALGSIGTILAIFLIRNAYAYAKKMKPIKFNFR